MKPLVSILIPLYNAEAWISETIQSAISQTWPNKEIIIVDDGSSDNSLKIAKSFKSAQIKVFHQNNSGGSSARNVAFRESSGEYIQYLDADDILAPDKIEEQMIRLETEQSKTIAAGSFGRFVKFKNKAKFSSDAGWNDHFYPIDWLIKVLLGQTMFPPIVWLTERCLIEDVGPWNEELTYNDDLEFFVRVLLKSKKLVFCENAMAYYRTDIPSSVGSRKDHSALVSRLKCLQLVSSHILGYEDSQRSRKACATSYQEFIFSTYPREKGLIKIAKKEIDKIRTKGYMDFGQGTFKFISRIVGWRVAKWLRYFYYKLKK